MSLYTSLPSPGELNRRVSIRLWSDTPNGAFGLDQSFGTPVDRWAKKEPVHSLAIRAGMQTGEQPTDLFWVRLGPGTRPEDFTLAHVIEMAGRRYRVIDAIDVNGAGVFTRVSTKDLGAI